MKTFKRLTLGVTLIEVTVVVAIAAILVLAAGSISSTYIAKTTVSKATAAVNTLLANASEEAQETNTTLYANIRPAANTWCIGLTDNANGCNCSSNSGSTSCTINGALTRIQGSNYDNTTLSVTHTPDLGSNITIAFDKIRGRVFPDLAQPNTAETTSIVFTITNSAGNYNAISLDKWGITSICSHKIGGYPAC